MFAIAFQCNLSGISCAILYGNLCSIHNDFCCNLLSLMCAHLCVGMTMERAKLEINPPRDRLNIVYLILLLHGVGTLMPWNMFITAKSVSERYEQWPAVFNEFLHY